MRGFPDTQHDGLLQREGSRAGDDARVTLGALLEILLMIGNVGTAVVMYPILRRYSETSR